MSLPYYRWFPGDYIRDTRRLSMLQHGAYRMLIDEYMVTGRPLPNDLPSLYRVCMALSNEEQRAVQYVLEEFFQLSGPVWRHKRCDEELKHSNDRVESAKRSINARWNKRNTNVDTNVEQTKYDRNTNQNQTQIKKENTSVVTDGFARFWMTWPKSDRKVAKAECLKRWKARGLDSEADAICKHVEWSKGTKQWREGYEPAPLTYLNQRRWEDASNDSPQSNEWAGAL